MTDLGTLGGTFSSGRAINISGKVAGMAYLTGDAIQHAVLWNATTPSDLGTLGGSNSYASSINASGSVTGQSQIAGDSVYRAFLYTQGTMYDLNDLLVPGSGVTDIGLADGGSVCINDLEQIAASGTIGGQRHALLLTPIVPEPSTTIFGVVGTFGLLFRRTRNGSNG
jgi:probable HAF family extracellular repeat protein